jgi:hypothetical protein
MVDPSTCGSLFIALIMYRPSRIVIELTWVATDTMSIDGLCLICRPHIENETTTPHLSECGDSSPDL